MTKCKQKPVCQSCLQGDLPLVGEWCEPCLDEGEKQMAELMWATDD